MKKPVAALFALAAVAAAADEMPGADMPVGGRQNAVMVELKEEIPACIYSTWCEGFQRRWRDVPTDSLTPLPQEKCDEMSDRYIAHCRKNADERPRGVEAWIDLGDALIFRDRWAEAEDAYAKAVANSKVKDLACSRALYGVAEAQFGAGRTNDCLETLKELSTYVNAKNKKGSAVFCNWARTARHYLTGGSPDRLGMPRDTGFKAFPQAQKAEYSETFTPCPEITINLSGVEKSDARVEYILLRKLSSRGFKHSFGKSGKYVLSISLDPNARVDRKEGYSLDADAKGTAIAARDRQGILWGIVSFIQILDPAGKRMRNCRIDDWPDCAHRGYLGAFWGDCTEFTVFNKMNSVTHQRHVLTDGRYTPLNMMMAAKMGKEFKDLGLDLYYGFLSYTQNMAWPYCWNSYLGMQIEAGKKIAALGVGIYYPNDDCRYEVVTKDDEATGLKPSDYDADHLLKWYNAIKAEYPDFKFQYCPPFYWGPTARHNYPDDREKYLKSLQKLPPEVLICWTGERVCSYKKSPAAVKWFTDLIGRKPILFQNRTGPHYGLSYIVDKTDWNGWHYPGFFENDVYGYQKNSHTPMECPQITSLADCLWNVKGYDMVDSQRRGLDQYVGAGLYEILSSVVGTLSKFDRYQYGKIDTRVRDENLAEVESDVKAIHEATDRAIELVGAAKMNEMGAWMRALGWADGILKAVKNPPNFRKQYATWTEQALVSAVSSGYEKSEGDILFDAIDFHHAGAELFPSPEEKGRTAGTRFAAHIPAGGAGVAKATVKFLPAKGDCTLNIYGQGGSREFEIWINGKKVYAGSNPLNHGWDGPYSKHSWKFPSSWIVKGENVLEIKNTEKEWYPVRVNYAAILMPKRKKSMEEQMKPKSELDDLTLDE